MNKSKSSSTITWSQTWLFYTMCNAMTKVLKRLKRNDFDVTPELLAALSPYRTSHINLLGQYPLEPNRRVKAQNYRL